MLLTGSQRETIGTFVPHLFHPPDEIKLPVARLCHNSKIGKLRSIFIVVRPLKFKNDALQANLRGAVFAENNYDTAWQRVVLLHPEGEANKARKCR